MGSYIISNPVKVGFNPEYIPNKAVKRVFQEDMARILWLAIASGHLIDGEYFPHHCLNAANSLREGGIPEEKDLTNLIQRKFGQGFAPGLAEALTPYLKGEKVLEYEVVN